MTDPTQAERELNRRIAERTASIEVLKGRLDRAYADIVAARAAAMEEAARICETAKWIRINGVELDARTANFCASQIRAAAGLPENGDG